MKISSGLMNGQVLQRNGKGQGSADIVGTCRSDGKVELRVLKGRKVVQPWKGTGNGQKKTFAARLEELRTGGPYRVELRIRKGRKIVESCCIEEVFVGDVWILAGQSNMEGVGNLVDKPKPHPLVRAFYMRDEWGIAEEKLHFLSEAVDRVHNGYGDGPRRPSQRKLESMRKNCIKGVGPGHAFGLEMYRRTRIPQGLVACAHGGTSMAQWSPALRDKGGASLYGAMMRRFQKLGQPVAGILWYQGESDAQPELIEGYTQNMIHLVAATRADMALPRLPWLVVQLGRHACPTGGAEWNSVQEQQRLLPQVIKQLDVAPAVDLALDDGVHIGGKAQCQLGKRLGRVADRLVHGNRKAKAGIALKGIRMVPTPNVNKGAACRSVELNYRNVAGKLMSAGLPAGFVLVNDLGEDTCGIYRTTIHGSRVLLHTNMAPHQLEQLSVSYGLGRYPCCNITDSEEMSLPAIQSMPIQPDHPRFCNNWQACPLKGVSGLARAGLTKVSKARGWRKAHLRDGFGVLPKAPEDKATGVFGLRTELKASEALTAKLSFGANAPFRLWLNGKPLLEDRKAQAPLNPVQYEAYLPLKKGKNQLVVAYAISKPAARFGISARVGTCNDKEERRIAP